MLSTMSHPCVMNDQQIPHDPSRPSLPSLCQTPLGEALRKQPWVDIGLGSGYIASSSNKEIMVKQMCSILEDRLSDIVISREVCAQNRNHAGSRSTLPTVISNECAEDNRKQDCWTTSSVLSFSVREELRLYVTRIASLYRTVLYHNFEHACHVTTSVNKMLSMLFEEEFDDTYDSIPSWYYIDSYACDRPKHRQSMTALEFHDLDPGSEDCNKDEHNTANTKSIYPDALTKFAVVFGALIHDVDHRGVPNMQLVKEGHRLAKQYNNRSVAEFHSLNMAFSFLMEPDFDNLRNVLMPNPYDNLKFRRTVIDVLMCTDIASPEQSQVTKSKWNEAFGQSLPEDQLWSSSRRVRRRHSLSGPVTRSHEMCIPAVADTQSCSMSGFERKFHTSNGLEDAREVGKNRAICMNGDLIEFYQKEENNGGQDRLKTSVVLETLMNAADVAHTMQSWDNFLKWNMKLYEELYAAHLAGRGGDPSANWYMGQIGFYDCYVLPLARRLSRCGEFGRSGGDIFLHNAQENKRRWMEMGEEITEAMIAFVQTEKRSFVSN